MTQYLYIAAIALLVSFSGSVPLGNLNITAMYIAGNGRLRPALLFALGATLVEMCYLRFTLGMVHLVLQYRQLLQYLQWAAVVLLMVLAAGSFMNAARYKANADDTKLPGADFPSFWKGVAMSAVNPAQLPFWAGWSVYVFTHRGIMPDAAALLVFTFAAGLGTFGALCLFIWAGNRLAPRLYSNKSLVACCMGSLFLLLGIVQAVQLIAHV